MKPEQAYHTSAREALVTLRLAMEEAKALLPEAVLRAHWLAGHHSLAPWAAVEAWYRQQPDADSAVSEIITDVKQMATALACLTSITSGGGTTGSLKLAKVRRQG